MNTLKTLQKTLGHRFRRKNWIEAALTHPSFRNEREEEASGDNQRLEFLGDAVIGLLVADYLFRNREDFNEGTMTQFRSGVTSREALARIGGEWNLGELMRFGEGETRSGGASRESNLADAVEAVIGAVYREGGLKACRPLFEKHFLPRLEELQEDSAPALRDGNPKGALQEWTQAHWKTSPTYKVVKQSGPAHDRTYTSAVMFDGEEIAKGRGASKRVAEAEAAAGALPVLQARVARSSSTEGMSS